MTKCISLVYVKYILYIVFKYFTDTINVFNTLLVWSYLISINTSNRMHSTYTVLNVLDNHGLCFAFHE